MSAHEVLYRFGDLIASNRIDEAKALITHENARMECPYQKNVIYKLCDMTTKDNPELLQYFVNFGATFVLTTQNYTNSLLIAACRGKPKMVRKLLDLGHPVNIITTNGYTALGAISIRRPKPLIASILLDYGGKCDTNSSLWVSKVCAFRESVRSSAISTMGALQRRKGVGKDVARMIGRSIWALRAIYEEDE